MTADKDNLITTGGVSGLGIVCRITGEGRRGVRQLQDWTKAGERKHTAYKCT